MSRTERSGTRWNVWKTNPSSALRTFARAASEYDSTFRPFSVTDPFVGASRSPITWRSVDFPEPDGPMIDTNSPSATSRLTFESAIVSIRSVRYTFSTFSSRIIAIPLSIP